MNCSFVPEDHVPDGGEEGAGAEAVYALFYQNIYSVLVSDLKITCQMVEKRAQEQKLYTHCSI